MSLLLLETKRAGEKFESLFSAWREERGMTLPMATGEVNIAFDHFPFALYELFRDVSLRKARLAALASRAAGAYASLLEHVASGVVEADSAEPACAWLESFVEEQLRDVVPAQSPFWRQFGTDFARCRAAFLPESDQKPCAWGDDFSRECLELIKERTALAGTTAKALASVSERGHCLDELLSSQVNLYIGLYLDQAYADWKRSVASGSSKGSMILSMLLRRLEEPAGRENVTASMIQELDRRFYYSGMAESLFESASEYFHRALAVGSDLPLSSWLHTVGLFLERNEMLLKEARWIRQSRERRTPGASPSHTSESDDGDLRESISGVRLKVAIDESVRFLCNAQEADGRWEDFLVSGEQSTQWVTGYVGWILAQTEKDLRELSRARTWLLEHVNRDNGWGYNEKSTSDPDSIAHVLLFLSRYEETAEEVVRSAIDLMMGFQTPDGGFTTVVDPVSWRARFRSDVKDLSGWMSSHPCVTAAAALMLFTVGDQRSRARALEAMEFLKSCQQDGAYWNAYWWLGEFYTTTRVLQARSAMGDPELASDGRSVAAWLVAGQGDDGGWAATAGGSSESFQTALAVQALCVVAREEPEVRALRRGVVWLLDRQRPDGSWPTVPIMFVPSPSVLEPWQYEGWRQSALGLDVIVADWHRLFTSATALQALHTFVSRSDPSVDSSDQKTR